MTSASHMQPASDTHQGRRNTNPRSLACAPALRQSAESQRQLRGTLLVQQSLEQV